MADQAVSDAVQHDVAAVIDKLDQVAESQRKASVEHRKTLSRLADIQTLLSDIRARIAADSLPMSPPR